MLKYAVALAMAFSFMACQQSGEQQQMADQNPTDQQQQMQDQMDAQQPAQSPEGADISDEDLAKFIEVSSAVQEIQMESQQEMITVVEEEGISVEVYNQIAQARYMGEDESELDISDEDREKFDNAYEVISEMEVEMEEQLAQKIEEEGMDMNQFQTISMALQQDPALQQRFQEQMQGSATPEPNMQ